MNKIKLEMIDSYLTREPTNVSLRVTHDSFKRENMKYKVI